MGSLIDKISAPVAIVIAVLVIGGAVVSAVHFLGGPAPINVSAYNASAPPPGPPVAVLGQGGRTGTQQPQQPN